MADELWDVVQWHEGRNKRFTQRLGYAKESKDGGFYITLTALPVPTLDRERGLRLQIQVRRPYKKDDRNRGNDNRGRGDRSDNSGFNDNLDDLGDPPF